MNSANIPMYIARLGLLAGLVLVAIEAFGQAPPAGAPQGAPSQKEQILAMFPPAPSTALGQRSTISYTLMDKLPTFPDQDGSGPFPATYAMAPGGLDYVVYQPKDLAAAAAKGKLGVYIWGNGGCGVDSAGARFHLTEIASRGYVAIAPGKILSGPKAPPLLAGAAPRGMTPPGAGATAEKMIAALDWILAENQRPGSPYFGAINPNKVAFSGHSCGGLIALKASLDPRANAVIVENSGVFKAPLTGPMANNPALTGFTKADLAKLRTPVLYILGGPEDIAEPNGLDDYEHIQQVPVFVADHPGAGHIGLFYEPNGEATKVEIDWLEWQLDHDQVAARTFTGTDCILCRDFRWKVYRKGIQ
jgi:dienelactone hydrolase